MSNLCPTCGGGLFPGRQITDCPDPFHPSSKHTSESYDQANPCQGMDCNGSDDSTYQDMGGNWYCGFCLLSEHNARLVVQMDGTITVGEGSSAMANDLEDSIERAVSLLQSKLTKEEFGLICDVLDMADMEFFGAMTDVDVKQRPELYVNEAEFLGPQLGDEQ